jgi:subtilisin family serine protease
MKKHLILILAASIAVIGSAQDRKGSFRLQKDSDRHELYVSFYSDDFLNQENALQIALENIDGFQQLAAEYSITLQKGIGIADSKLEKFANNAIKNSKSSASVYKLKKIYKVQIPHNDNETLYALAEKLELLDAVEYVSLVSLSPIEPPYDILPPPTPNYEYLQTYLDPNPGVNIRHAWSLGLIGEGIRVRDVEYGFNKNHEALNERNVALAPGMDISPDASVAFTEHGTAVFGIVIGDPANYGMTGMAHGASELWLFPEWQSVGYDRIYAVQRSIAESDEGDVIIYEMQTGGCYDQYVPAEYDNVVWDLTKAATDAGIVIVAAAGNGTQDLDDPCYDAYNARGNSGAIIVGAGSPDVSHTALYFTTYGSRVDVQGWGLNVFASGYGDYFQLGGDFDQNYTMFSGTSSATPIVASCVIVLQSYYHSLTGTYMTGKEIRDILVETGIPQGGSKHIGPLPNVKNAIEAIDDMFKTCKPPTNLSIETDETCLVSITWKNPEGMTDITYNIYKDNALVAENYSDTLYSETINFGETFEWCIETVCEDGNSKKECIVNEICYAPCKPPTNISIKTDETCLVTIAWKKPEETTGIINYNIFKDNLLIIENYSDTIYSETIDFEKVFEWCIATVCKNETSEKECVQNETCTVSITETDLNDMFLFFPNPAYNKLTIKSQTSQLPNTKIELLNINGTFISSHVFINNEANIALEGLSSGVYFVRIQTENGVIIKKFVKL